MQSQQLNKSFKVILEDTLTINKIKEAYGILKTASESGLPIKVDCDQLTQIDTSGIQLLLAFNELTIQKKLDVEWHGNTDLIEKKSSALGLKRYFESIIHR